MTISVSPNTVRVNVARWGTGHTYLSHRKLYVSVPHDKEQDGPTHAIWSVWVDRAERGQQWALTTPAPSGRLHKYKSKPVAQGKGIELFTPQNPLTGLTIGGVESGIPLPTSICCAGLRCTRSRSSPILGRLRVRSRSLGHNLSTRPHSFVLLFTWTTLRPRLKTKPYQLPGHDIKFHNTTHFDDCFLQQVYIRMMEIDMPAHDYMSYKRKT